MPPRLLLIVLPPLRHLRRHRRLRRRCLPAAAGRSDLSLLSKRLHRVGPVRKFRRNDPTSAKRRRRNSLLFLVEWYQGVGLFAASVVASTAVLYGQTVRERVYRPERVLRRVCTGTPEHILKHSGCPPKRDGVDRL
jgi:hypothetical protein